MQSKLTKLTVSAAIVIAVFLGLNIIGQPDISNVAWADVIRPILNAQTASLDIIIGSQGNQTVIHDEVIGSRIRRTVSGMNAADIIIDLKKQQMVTLDHPAKTAVCIDLGGLDNLENYLELLRSVILRLQDNPGFVVENRGLQEFEGQSYIVFVAESEKETLTIWADPETALPMRIEQKTPNMRIVCDNLQFDIELDESRFSMEVPDNYTVQTSGIDFKNNSEDDFIETLRIWAEIIENGCFPESIDLADIVKIGPKFDRGLKKANLTEQQQLEVATQWGQGLMFIRFFQGEGKWHYAGAGVELGDAEAPVFWYKPKDSEYWRVIYGDLHMADVAPADLPDAAPSESQTKIFQSSKQWEDRSFVGDEQDRWHIAASGQIVAYSEITLKKLPEQAEPMYVKMPYPAAVMESVTLGDEHIPFERITQDRYELTVPFDRFIEEQTKVICTWIMPFDSITETEKGFRIKLQGLIQTESFRLTVYLEPDCGFEFTSDPSQTSMTLFGAIQMFDIITDGNSCLLPIRRNSENN